MKAEEQKVANGVGLALSRVFDLRVDKKRVFDVKGPELMNFGAKQPGQADYLSACKSLYETVKERVIGLKDVFKNVTSLEHLIHSETLSASEATQGRKPVFLFGSVCEASPSRSCFAACQSCKG